jgi:hypothetical protein
MDSLLGRCWLVLAMTTDESLRPPLGWHTTTSLEVAGGDIFAVVDD